MCAALSKELGFTVSKWQLRRFLKKLGYSWKRFRKSLKGRQFQEEYEKRLKELKQLIELHRQGYIDLFFGDESGFNMEGYVPYGWQPKGERVLITPSKTRSTNVFGLMSLNNQLAAYTCEGSINSAAAIAFIDDFESKISKRTVIVLDNAPIHHSKAFKDKIEEWKEKDVGIFFLPRYSPHLNPIEILWRKMKYEWIEYENISSQDELQLNVDEILVNFGEKYSINFKEDLF